MSGTVMGELGDQACKQNGTSKEAIRAASDDIMQFALMRCHGSPFTMVNAMMLAAASACAAGAVYEGCSVDSMVRDATRQMDINIRALYSVVAEVEPNPPATPPRSAA